MQSDAISPLNLQPKGLKTIQLTGRALENKWYNRKVTRLLRKKSRSSSMGWFQI